MSRRNHKAQVSVLGYVDPHDWDSQGRLTKVAITSDEGCFVIVPAGLGEELLELVDTEVQVTGTVEAYGEQMYLAVKSYDSIYDLDDGDPDHYRWDGDERMLRAFR